MNVNAIDRHVGARLRARREHLGLSRDQIARALSTTVDHVERMEQGTMRASAEYLFILTRKLGVAPAYFFEGLDIGY